MALHHLHRPNADLSLMASGGPFCPGDTVYAHVALKARQDFHVRTATVSLVCNELYWMDVKSFAGIEQEPRGFLGPTNRHVRELLESSAQFLNETRVQGGVTYSDDMEFEIPKELPPTVNGRLAKITWHIEASLDVAGARDIRNKQQIEVLSVDLQPSTRGTEQEHSIPQDNARDLCDLSLSLPYPHARPGDSFEGNLHVRSLLDVSFHEVRVELICWERAGEKEKETVDDAMVLSRQCSLSCGEEAQWPFVLYVPKILRPSLYTYMTTVLWRVRGVLSRRMQRDITLEKEIKVYACPRSH